MVRFTAALLLALSLISCGDEEEDGRVPDGCYETSREFPDPCQYFDGTSTVRGSKQVRIERLCCGEGPDSCITTGYYESKCGPR